MLKSARSFGSSSDKLYLDSKGLIGPGKSAPLSPCISKLLKLLDNRDPIGDRSTEDVSPTAHCCVEILPRARETRFECDESNSF